MGTSGSKSAESRRRRAIAKAKIRAVVALSPRQAPSAGRARSPARSSGAMPDGPPDHDEDGTRVGRPSGSSAGWQARMHERGGDSGSTERRVTTSSATASSRSTSSRGAGGVDDDATSGEVTTRWQLRKLEEARARERRKVETAREKARRDRELDARIASMKGAPAPRRDPLDDLDPADAMGRLDDVPLSDAEPEDDDDRHDHLPPMERAMRRAAEARIAREGEPQSRDARRGDPWAYGSEEDAPRVETAVEAERGCRRSRRDDSAFDDRSGGVFDDRSGGVFDDRSGGIFDDRSGGVFVSAAPRRSSRRRSAFGAGTDRTERTESDRSTLDAEADDRAAASEARAEAAERRASAAERALADALRRAETAERRAEAAERRASTAERRVNLVERGTVVEEPGMPPGPAWLAPGPRSTPPSESPSFGNLAEELEARTRPTATVRGDDDGGRVVADASRADASNSNELNSNSNAFAPPILSHLSHLSHVGPGVGGDRNVAEGTSRFEETSGVGVGVGAGATNESERNVDRRRFAGVRASSPPARGGSNPSAMTRRAVGGGDGAAVGAIGDLKSEVSRMRRSARQSADKERAMLDQLNALRRAKDASENRVKDLARELQEARVDSREWTREERRVAAGMAREPTTAAAAAEASTPRPRGGGGSRASFGLNDDVASDSGSESEGGGGGGEHPVFRKIRHGRVDEAAAMLNGVGGGAGLDPDVRDRFGNTPLIVAAQNNRKRISKMCVRVGADVDAVNARGNAALHYCYAYSHFELGEYLVSKGADPEIRNADGQTPRETLTPEKVRALEETRRRVAQRRARSAMGRRTRDRANESDADASATDASESESDGGGLDSYRALYDE